MTDPTSAAPTPRNYGKRKLADAREKFVAVRCSAAEHAALTAAAAQAGLSVGAFLRATALGRPGPRAVRRATVETEALARLLGEFGKLGSNVNQLARVANTNGDIPARDQLDGIAAEVRRLSAATMKALGHGD